MHALLEELYISTGNVLFYHVVGSLVFLPQCCISNPQGDLCGIQLSLRQQNTSGRLRWDLWDPLNLKGSRDYIFPCLNKKLSPVMDQPCHTMHMNNKSQFQILTCHKVFSRSLAALGRFPKWISTLGFLEAPRM